MNDSNISMNVARRALRTTKNNPYGLCMVCLSKGSEVPATNELPACNDPRHSALLRPIHRWAKRIAASVA